MNYVSLFSGAGGFDIGFDAAGFTCLAQVEIDKTARSVLAKRWPGVPRFEDVRQFGVAQVPMCDVVVGGFPCQDVSTAGKRLGFERGERSSLWFEMVRVIRELRPLYVVWENVPGLLSADEGRAFGHVLRELADLGFDGGWRTVDAQFFGVPQQRKRVFGVHARGHSGAERCAEILALTEGVRRDSQAGREARADAAGRTGSGTPGGRLSVYGNGAGGERSVCGTLTTGGMRQDFDTDNFVLIQDARGTDKGQGGLGARVSSVSYTLDTLGSQAVLVPCILPDATPKGRQYGLSFTLTSRAERGRGQDMSVCIPIDMRQASRGETMTNNRKEGSSGGAPGTGIGKDGGPAPTVSTSHPPAVAFYHTGGTRGLHATDPTPPLKVGSGGNASTMAVCVTVPVTHTLTGEGHDASEDGTGRGQPIVTVSPGVVRRLTPRECERLMGWPDDHTRWRDNGHEIADGPRYKLCGNGVVGTVAKWVATRLKRVQEQSHASA